MSIYDQLHPIDLSEISTYALSTRPSKVTVSDFAVPAAEGETLAGYLSKLPDILAVKSQRRSGALGNTANR